MNRKRKFLLDLGLRTLLNFTVSCVVYTIAVFLGVLGGILICDAIYWRGDEFLYHFFRLIADNIVVAITLACLSGYFFFFLFWWYRTLRYAGDILTAAESIFQPGEELIQLPTALKEAENRLNQLKLQAQGAQRAAREAEQRKNDLVIYLAHDLKTPLTSVIGYLTLLRDERQISPELQEKYLSIALDKAERLEELINEFFEITRFNLSSLTLELSQVNLSRMLEQLVFEFQPMFQEKSLRCTLSIPPDTNIRCDVQKLQRVLDNLLRNAVNYSFEGSVIEITVTPQDGGFTFTFFNHGNTIPPEKLERIFEQFYRLDAARASRNGGAGLGLAIAKEIVELHHGTISAASAGETVTFTMFLPAL